MGEFNRAAGDGWDVPVTRDGKTETWHLSNWSQKCKGRYEAWLESTVLKAVMDGKRSMLPADYAEQLGLFYEAKALGKYSWGEPACVRSLQSSAGICKLFQLLLEKSHPETAAWSQDQINQLIADQDGFTEVFHEVLTCPNSSTPGE